MSGIRLPKVEHEEQRFLTPGEVADLTNAIDQRYRTTVAVGAYAGLRIGEVLGLRTEDIDLLGRKLTVRRTVSEISRRIAIGPPKTKASRRTIAIPETLAAELELPAPIDDPTR
jgi:integrase